MRVSKLFYKILYYRKTGILIYFFIFLSIFMMIASQMKDQINQEVEIRKLKVLVFDHDKSTLSKGLVDYLYKKNDEVEIEEEDDKIKDAIFENRLDYALIIPKGFENSLGKSEKIPVKTLTGIDKQNTALIDRQINSYLGIYQGYKGVYGGELTPSDKTYVRDKMEKVLDVDIKASLLEKNNKDLVNFVALNYFLRFMDYIVISVLFLSIGGIVTKLELANLKRRELISGFSDKRRTWEVFLSSYGFTSVFWLFLVLVGLAFSSFSLLQEKVVLWMLFSSYIHALSFSSLVLFVAQIFRSQRLISFLSSLLSLAISFGTGIFVPREFVWKPLLKVSMLFPTGWDIRNNYHIEEVSSALENFNKNMIIESIAIMVMMALVFLILTLIVRKTQEREEV